MKCPDVEILHISGLMGGGGVESTLFVYSSDISLIHAVRSTGPNQVLPRLFQFPPGFRINEKQHSNIFYCHLLSRNMSQEISNEFSQRQTEQLRNKEIFRIANLQLLLLNGYSYIENWDIPSSPGGRWKILIQTGSCRLILVRQTGYKIIEPGVAQLKLLCIKKVSSKYANVLTFKF